MTTMVVDTEHPPTARCVESFRAAFAQLSALDVGKRDVVLRAVWQTLKTMSGERLAEADAELRDACTHKGARLPPEDEP